MKTLICTLFTTVLLFLSASLQSNPIPPPSLIVEVYFDNGEWVLVVDNIYMMAWGIEDFEGVEIFSSNGYAYINPDVVPDPDEWVTLLTADDLTQPLEIDPVEDHVGAWVSGGFTLCDLEWGPDPDDVVSGPEPWQSIVISYVASTPEWNYMFWPLMGASHNCYATACAKHGVFTGYVTDQYNNPVPGGEICYLPDELLFSEFGFYHIITDASGQYLHPYMPARNYHIEKIMFDDAEYPVDEFISIEPNDTLNLDFTIYLTDINTVANTNKASIRNFPNPFSNVTSFSGCIPDHTPGEVCAIEIVNIAGKIVAIINISSNTWGSGGFSTDWNAGAHLAKGTYFARLKTGKEMIATTKITIK